jgi:hypothetical protein
VQEHRTLDEMWQRKAPLIAEETSFDPNRDAGDAPQRNGQPTVARAQAFQVGPVQVAFGEQKTNSSVAPLAPWVGPEQITSNTSELVWNTLLGYCTVNTAQVQGVVAHFGNAATHQLQDVRFVSHNDFGAALAVSMDGEALRASRKILIQFATQSRPNGWKESPSNISLENGATTPGFTLESFGQSPWQVQSADLDIMVRNPHIRRGTVLDMNGMALQTIPLTRQGELVSLRFPPNAMYLVLQ